MLIQDEFDVESALKEIKLIYPDIKAKDKRILTELQRTQSVEVTLNRILDDVIVSKPNPRYLTLYKELDESSEEDQIVIKANQSDKKTKVTNNSNKDTLYHSKSSNGKVIRCFNHQLFTILIRLPIQSNRLLN